MPNWKAGTDYPEWMTIEGLHTLQGGYLYKSETPKEMYQRVAKAASDELQRPALGLEDKFFEIMWKGWLCPASPVLTNLGTTRGIPISCLTGDARVITRDGSTAIADLQVGDEVLTHMGRFKPVEEKWSRESAGDLYEMVVSGRTTRLRITGNHPVLTNRGWVRVDELDPLVDYVAADKAVDFGVVSTQVVDLLEFADDKYRHETRDGWVYYLSGGKFRSKGAGRSPEWVPETDSEYLSPFPARVPIDDDLGWLLGLWCAEGSINIHAGVARTVRITLHKNEEHLAKRWQKVADERFGTKTFITPAGNKNWIQVNTCSRPLCDWLMKHFGSQGHLCTQKSLPRWYYQQPDSVLKATLEGFLQGDGTVRRTGRRFVVSNPKLASGMYLIGLKLGEDMSVRLDAKPGKFSSVQHVCEVSIMNKQTGPSKTRRGIDFGTLRYYPIRRLEKLDRDETVYDIRVKDDHSFSVAGVVVHNCYGVQPDDDLHNIFTKAREAAMLSKGGGGVGIGISKIRHRGSLVGEVGVSDGVIPWCKLFEASSAAKQGQLRKGAFSVNLDITHPDFPDFLRLHDADGDPNLRTPRLHTCVNIPDGFMAAVESGDEKARLLWREILMTRMKRGEPYILFSDTVNRANPAAYLERGLRVDHTNICLTGDQRLHTAEGYRTLRELWMDAGCPDLSESVRAQVGTLPVVNRKGVVQATSVYRTSKKSSVFKLVLRSGKEIRATAEHKFFVSVPAGKTSTNKLLFSEKKLPLKDLRPGDLLIRSKEDGVFGNTHEPEYATLAGLIIGDGSVSKVKSSGQVRAHVRLWNEDIEECGPIVTQTMRALYEKHCMSGGGVPNQGQVSGKIKTNFGYRRADVNSLVLGRMLREDGVVPGNKHRVPTRIWASDEETVCAFLRGLFSADGHVLTAQREKVQSITVRMGQTKLGLLQEVQTLLSQLGIPATVYKSRREAQAREMNNGRGGTSPYNGAAYHELVIGSHSACSKFMSKVGFIQKSQNDKAMSWLDSHQGSTSILHLWEHDEVKSIEPDGEEEVFCLTEPESNEIVINGTVLGQCSEIVLASDRRHTYVCCLASQNLTRFPDLSRNESVYWGTWFLDGVMSIFIRLAGKAKVYANAVRFAEKSRAIGMGALGYHAALQDRMMPFASLGARLQNRSMFEHIQVESDRASQDLAREYGEPEWCQGTGFRHTHRRAVAPTFSNAIISGTDAQSIEPLIVNAGTAGTSKGVALRKNPRLDRILTESGRNSPEIWQSIVREQGSVQHLDMLSAEEKEVFKTAFEIDQREIVRQAADRQKYIDQSQSLNLFFTQDASPKYVNETHLLAHKLGVKTLYYLRSTAPLRADSASRQTTVAAEVGGPAPCGSACEG